MASPSVLSFDLDDTLWPVAPVIEAAERHLWEWLVERYPLSVRGHSIATMRALREQVAADHPEHGHDFTFLRHRALERQLRQAGYGESAADEALEVFFSARNRVEFYPDARSSLELLRGRYRLYALSNGNADLERCGIAHLFDGHVTARGAGAAKPDARIFAALLKAADVAAADVLHIGDDPLADVHGARGAGMQAAWLNRDARPWPPHLSAPTRILRTLSELV